MLRATFNANNFGGRLEGGYRFATPVVGVTPYAAVQAQSFRTPDYSETAASGSAQFALNYGAQSSTATRTELGAWLDKPRAAARRRARAARPRRLGERPGRRADLGAAFQALPGSSFTVPARRRRAIWRWSRPARNCACRQRSRSAPSSTASSPARAQTYSGAGFVRYAW